MLLALVTLPALADAIAAPQECFTATPSVSVPATGATGVPLDITPAVVFVDGGCGVGQWQLTLTRGDDGSELGTVIESPDDLLLELDLDGELDADTDYVLTLTPLDGTGTQSLVEFRTGATHVVPHGVVPQVSAVEPGWRSDTLALRTVGTVEFGAGGGQDLLTRWTVSDPDEAFSGVLLATDAVGTEAVRTVLVEGLGELPDEACLTVETRELDGVWNVSETVCAAVEDKSPAPGLCATSGGAAGAVGAALALVAALGRRRS